MPFGPNKTLPEKCQIQDNDRIYKIEAFGENLAAAIQDLKDGFGLVMIYHDNIDAIGHSHGPDTQKAMKKLLKALTFSSYLQQILVMFIQ